jgi:hypothetical protein
VSSLWEDRAIIRASLFPSHEQRKIEKLLLKLAKLKPISAIPAPVMNGSSSIKAALDREKAS